MPSREDQTNITSIRSRNKGTKQQQKVPSLVKKSGIASSTLDVKASFRMSPLSTPLHRRLQTAAVLWHTISIPLFSTLFLIYMSIPLFWVLTVPYLVYMLLDNTPLNGNVTKRYSPRLRKLWFWKRFCEYFPMTIHRTTSLEPTFTDREISDDYYKLPAPLKYVLKIKKKTYTISQKTGPIYIFGLHPHGVVSLSGFGAFGTEGARWSILFPGIRACVLTLLNQFRIPVYRDYLLALGITSAERKNALEILKRGYSVVIVVGGAQEALLAKPGSTDLILNKRKGFIKLALETGGVSLVPCFAFGENEVYNVLKPGDSSVLRKLQIWLKQNFGFTLPFFHARGIFNYDFGFLPYRKPINIVTGNPIPVEYLPNANSEQIAYYHELYEKELTKIFNENKEKYQESQNKSSHLNFVQ